MKEDVAAVCAKQKCGAGCPVLRGGYCRYEKSGSRGDLLLTPDQGGGSVGADTEVTQVQTTEWQEVE